MKIRRYRLTGLALIATSIVVLALPALAANSVTNTNNGNRLTVTVGENGNTFTCSGTNTRSTGQAVDFILVSAVCQYRDNNMVWHDFVVAPANDATNASSVSVSFTDNPCTSPGLNLPSGNWKIRGQADGRYEQPSGTDHPYNGTLSTTATFPVAECNQ